MDLPIKLISTDFDGTIFAEFDKPPTPPTLLRRLQLLQQQGVKWVINTGRDLSSLLESMARAQFTIRPDFLIIVEREIYTLEGHEFVSSELWNDRCQQVHDEIFQRVSPDVPKLTEWINARFDATLYHDDYSPLCLLAKDNDDATEISSYLEEYCRSVPDLVVVRNDVYARLSHSHYNKGTALAEVSRQLGITADHVFAAGDHLNDLPMLDRRYARYLAGPANAVPLVREAIERGGGYISHQPCGFGIERALEWFLEQPHA